MKGIEFSIQKALNQIHTMLIKPKVNLTADIFEINYGKFCVQGLQIAQMIINQCDIQKHIPVMFQKLIAKLKQSRNYKPEQQNQSDQQYENQYPGNGSDQVTKFINSRKPINLTDEAKKYGELNWYADHMDKKKRDTLVFLQNVSKIKPYKVESESKQKNKQIQQKQYNQWRQWKLQKQSTKQRQTQTGISWVGQLRSLQESSQFFQNVLSSIPEYRQRANICRERIEKLQMQYSQVCKKNNQLTDDVQKRQKFWKQQQSAPGKKGNVAVIKNKNKPKNKKQSVRGSKRSTAHKLSVDKIHHSVTYDRLKQKQEHQLDQARRRSEHEMHTNFYCQNDNIPNRQIIDSAQQISNIPNKDKKSNTHEVPVSEDGIEQNNNAQNQQVDQNECISNQQLENGKIINKFTKNKQICKLGLHQPEYEQGTNNLRKQLELVSIHKKLKHKDGSSESKISASGDQNSKYDNQKSKGKESLKNLTHNQQVRNNKKWPKQINVSGHSNINSKNEIRKGKDKQNMSRILSINLNSVNKRKELNQQSLSNYAKFNSQYKQSQAQNQNITQKSKKISLKTGQSFYEQRLKFKTSNTNQFLDKIKPYIVLQKDQMFKEKNRQKQTKKDQQRYSELQRQGQRQGEGEKDRERQKDRQNQNLPSIHMNKHISSQNKKIKNHKSEHNQLYRQLQHQRQKNGLDISKIEKQYLDDHQNGANVKIQQEQLLKRDQIIRNKINELQLQKNLKASPQLIFYLQLLQKMHRRHCGKDCKHLQRFYKQIRHIHGWSNRIPITLPTRKIGFFGDCI